MKKIHLLVFAAIISLAMFSSMTVATMPPWEPMPRLDTQYFKVIKTEDARIDALTVTEEVDYIPGPGTTSGIETVLAWGANQSWAPSASYGFNALQCRHVWPEEAEGGTEGKVPGETVSPMNFSGFRVALSYIFGMDDKNASIFDYYQGPQTFGIQSIIPPAQATWFDPTAKQGVTSYATAEAWLTADGFYVDEGILYDANDIPCRDLQMYYSTGATAWEMMLPDMVAAFNDFMDNHLGVTNCNLALASKDFETLVYGNLLNYHDYDIIAIGLTGLGADCDWVISMFHSLYDVVWGWNFAGVHDDYIDLLMETIQYSMDPDVIKQAVHDFQHYFNGEMPTSAIDFGATGVGMMPHFLWTSGMTIQSYHPDLDDWIPQPCYGSEQCELTWPYLSWGAGSEPAVPGAVRRAVGDEPGGMNPFYENTLYGWLIGLDGCCEGLLRSHPKTLEPIPWLADHYYYEGPLNTTTPTGLNIVNGMVLDYYIREGVYWQDTGAYEDLNDNDVWDEGEPKYEFPFTSYDVKFAADMMVKHEIGRYDTAWIDLVETQTHGPYKVTFYYNSSSYWMSTYPSSFSFFPQHIYQKADKMVDDGTLENFGDFYPYSTNYEDWTGCHPPDEWGAPPTGPGKPGYWSALVGTGPFIFGYYNVETWVGETHANTRWWVRNIQQSLHSYNEKNGINCFKETYEEEIMVLRNTSIYNPSAPSCSYWEDETAIGNRMRWWHIDGWKDRNMDGLVSVCDKLTLSSDVCGGGQWSGQGEYHVEVVVWDDPYWYLTVRKEIDTPKLTHMCLYPDSLSMYRWRYIDVYYEAYWYNTDTQEWVFVDDGERLCLAPWDPLQEQLEIPTELALTIPSCYQTFKVDFSIRLSECDGGEPEAYHYVCTKERTFAYVIGDGTCDCTVNMIDIYGGVLNFLITHGAPEWLFEHLGIKPAKWFDINQDGVVNMIDIYIMIIQFMECCDC